MEYVNFTADDLGAGSFIMGSCTVEAWDKSLDGNWDEFYYEISDHHAYNDDRDFDLIEAEFRQMFDAEIKQRILKEAGYDV